MNSFDSKLAINNDQGEQGRRAGRFQFFTGNFFPATVPNALQIHVQIVVYPGVFR
jgi:hypothetical protein